MGRLFRSEDELTAEELQRRADAKIEEADRLADSDSKRWLLAEAEELRLQARLKGWLHSDLRPPG
jgi:uncharacterized protein HemX